MYPITNKITLGKAFDIAILGLNIIYGKLIQQSHTRTIELSILGKEGHDTDSTSVTSVKIDLNFSFFFFHVFQLG